MPNYTVALVGPPRSTITTTSRSYECLMRICTDGEPCDLFPAKIQNTQITYPNPLPNGPPKAAIPQLYDLTFFGCPDEVDAGAFLSASSGRDQVEPNDCDYDELEALRGTPVPTKDCLCCREYAFTWTADVRGGVTDPDEVVNNCPDISIDSFVIARPVDCAEFLGFHAKAPCEDTEFPYVLVQDDNIEDDVDPAVPRQCLIDAFNDYRAAMETAKATFDAARAAASVFGAGVQQIQLQVAETAYVNDRKAAFAAFQAAHGACITGNPNLKTCFPMVKGECMPIIMPNGSRIQLQSEFTDKILTIEHLALDHDFQFFNRFESKVNCAYWSVAIPCRQFGHVFPSGTLKLNKVDARTTTFNNRDMWTRRYEFHYRFLGWDEYIPLQGVDRAACLGSPEGTFFVDDEGVCQAGTFASDSCLDNCDNIPGKSAIFDVFGNGIREPMNLTENGQPMCRQDLSLYTGWETVSCADFNLLPLPQFENPDFIRDSLNGPAPGDPPDEQCDPGIAGATRTIFYKDVNETYTWLCDCSGGPCSWVNVP